MDSRLFYLIAPFAVGIFTTCEAPFPESAAANRLPFTTENVVPKVAASPAARRHLSSAVLFPENPDTMPFLSFDPPMMQALLEQADYLRRPDVKERLASGITKNEMLYTVDRLQTLQLYQPQVMLESFDFYRVNTTLKSDRVRVTGYYTPVIQASRVPTAEFAIPLLRRPESNVPSPHAIWSGALANRDLELAWVRTEKELRNAQLQGSCLVEYPDGKREHFGYGGAVKGAGGAYVFFSRVGDRVLGSGTFPITAGYSVAVDPRYIPIGSTLLAELPDLDAAGKLKGYTYRILFAQDRGGAILTTKRIDLYCGVGKKGLQEARKINGHGRLWLMLPK
jgi:membrane-bound lytic murein transglycosylase A